MNPNAVVLTSIGNLSMLFIRVSPYTLQVSHTNSATLLAEGRWIQKLVF